MEELLPVATSNRDGLLPKSRALIDTSVTLPSNSSMLLFDTETHKCFVDVYLYHAYRAPIRASLIVQSEPEQILCKVAYINGDSSKAEFYYSKQANGKWGVYVKNLQNGVMAVTCEPVAGINTAIMTISNLPSDAKKIDEG